MLKDFFNYLWLVNKADDAHLALALGTGKEIGLINSCRLPKAYLFKTDKRLALEVIEKYTSPRASLFSRSNRIS